MAHTTLQDSKGNSSSSRLAGLTIIYSSIFFLGICFVFAFVHPDQAASIIGIGSSLFTAMNVVACVYLSNNKKLEIGNLLQNKGIDPLPPNN